MTDTKASRLVPLLFVALLFLCLFFPKTCAEGVKKGLETASLLALPALFPPLVISRALSLTFGRKRGRFSPYIPFFLGLLCGFPIGALSVSNLVKDGALTKKEGEKMLFFCNNTGPSFLIAICGETLMGNALYGWFLFLLQTFLSFCFFLLYMRKIKAPCKLEPMPTLPFARILTESLKGAAEAFLFISACILFFSYLTSLLSLLPLSPFFRSFVSLGLEVTGGVQSLAGMEKRICFPLCAAGVGFGGFSVHAQSLAPIREAGMKSTFYFSGKVFFAFFLFLGAEILTKCLSMN